MSGRYDVVGGEPTCSSRGLLRVGRENLREETSDPSVRRVLKSSGERALREVLRLAFFLPFQPGLVVVKSVHLSSLAPPCLSDSLTNRGTAFTAAERRRLHVEGRLPPRVESLEEQTARVVANVRAKADPLERYRYLSAVQSENEILFYRVVLDHLEEMLPIIYTPTVGRACLEWSRLYERPRGLYISEAQHAGRVADLLRHWPRRAAIIVVIDGGRILGLGDLGVNGMGIPIGKLALYTACAGVLPEVCLPIALDVGTDVDSVRSDATYLGDRRARLAGERYDAFLEEFITATQAVFPGAVVQFEDFNNTSAFSLLRRYRDRLCCFNDDIQGTGAMGLAGLYSAGRITGRPLNAQRILFVGAGEACLGIGDMAIAAMQQEGLSEAEARQRCLFIDPEARSSRAAPISSTRSAVSPRTVARPPVWSRRSTISGRQCSSAHVRQGASSHRPCSMPWRA